MRQMGLGPIIAVARATIQIEDPGTVPAQPFGAGQTAGVSFVLQPPPLPVRLVVQIVIRASRRRRM